METSPLLKKLELAARKSLQLVDEEREKQAHGAYFPLNTRHPRVLARETFYQHEHETLLGVIEQVDSFSESIEEEEKEEVVFVARRLIAEVSYPWIRRKILDEEHCREIYHDKEFEPYAKGLPCKQKAILGSFLDILGLSNDLEKELGEELRRKVPTAKRKEYVPLVRDVVEHAYELRTMFKDDWSKKANLIIFRLYELGVGEKGKE